MKTEPKQIKLHDHINEVSQLLAEPFLLVGCALAWAVVLPVAALLSVVVAAEEQVHGYFSSLVTKSRFVRHVA